MKPYFLDSVETAGGEEIKKFMPASYGSLMTAGKAAGLTELMRAVVTEEPGQPSAPMHIRWRPRQARLNLKLKGNPCMVYRVYRRIPKAGGYGPGGKKGSGGRLPRRLPDSCLIFI